MLRVPSDLKPSQFESLKIRNHTFVAYRNDVYPNKYEVFFEDHALIYVLEGEKVFNAPDQSTKVKKGDVLFIERGLYFLTESINESYKSLVFFFEEKLLKNFVENHSEIFSNLNISSENTSFFKIDSNFELGQYVESLMPYFKSKTNYLEYFLTLKLQELLLHILEQNKDGKFKQLLAGIFAKRKTELDYIMNTYYLKALNLNELAKLSGRSLSVFKKDFHETYGTSPALWIKNKRLDYAQLLLEKQQKNVSEVAEEIGYKSTSHFIKAFKKKFNSTPKRY